MKDIHLMTWGYPDRKAELDRLAARQRWRWTVLAICVASAILVLIATARAQTPPPDANVRALQAVNGELMQAWTSARAAMLQLQDQLAASQAEVKELKDQRAKAEADKAHALPDPAAPK